MIFLKQFALPEVVQSPMANCTDLAFRLVARAHGMRFAFLEMISAEALLRDTPQTLAMMQTTPEDQPVGVQLVGCEPERMGEAAAKVESMGFSLVDINLGCPVPKIVSKGGGSQLLKEPDTARRIFSAIVRAVRCIPVTVKMRLGYSDPSGAEAARIARIAQACGVDAVAVHGRTREQGYTGSADYEAIGRVKAAVSIPVIGNGDVVDAASAQRLRAISGCDGVMLGRGALGNPWIYRELEAVFAGEAVPPAPTLEERKAALVRHIELLCRYHPTTCVGARGATSSLRAERRWWDHTQPVGPLRRIIQWYIREQNGCRAFRDAITRATSVEQMYELIHAFVPGEVPV